MRGRQVAPSGMVPRPQEEDIITSPIMSVSVASSRSVSVPGSLPPSLGQLSGPVHWVNDQSCVRGATGFGFDNVSDNVTNVAFPPSASTSFDPSALLLPSSDSGFSSRSFPRLPSSSSSAPSLPLPISAPPSISSLAPSAPSISVPIFSPPSVVPSLLSSSSSSVPSFSALSVPPLSVPFSAPPSHPSSLSFSAHSFPSSPAPPPGFSAPASVPLPSSHLTSSAPSSWPVASVPTLSAPGAPLGFPSASFGDFAECQARVLGLSAEYQVLGRWFVASGGSHFPAYLSAHCPHLDSDFCLDFSSGSSRFRAALASSASLPPPSSSTSSSHSPFPLAAPLPPSSHPSSSLAPSFPRLRFRLCLGLRLLSAFLLSLPLLLCLFVLGVRFRGVPVLLRLRFRLLLLFLWLLLSF